MEEGSRRKKSNFDVGPEELGLPAVPPGASQIPLALHAFVGGVIIVPHGGEPPVPIRSLIDQTEKDRIKRATDRNLAYIRRKVSEEAQRKFAHPEEEDDAYHFDPHKPKKSGMGYAGQKRSRAGIGATPMGPAPGAPVGDVAVYVSNLPRDATWSMLDSLFQPFGTVRRIKLYRDASGNPKGDALVTFAKPGSADMAVRRANGLKMDETHAISVTKADFSTKGEEVHDGIGLAHAHPAQEEDEQADYETLPPECEADKYPVVIMRNVYVSADAEGDPDFFTDLEADMLSEAVKFGHVRRIVTPEGPYYEGSVAVVFGTTADAQKCAQAMHGRFFDGRMIEVEMQGNMDPSLVPQHISGPLVSYPDDDEEGGQGAKENVPSFTEGGKEQEPVEDVDAFFKSLEGAGPI